MGRPFADVDPVFGEEIGKLFGELTLPVLLGKGKRLFDERSEPRAFDLTRAVSPNRLIHATMCAMAR
jgi:hypothetical protein